MRGMWMTVAALVAAIPVAALAQPAPRTAAFSVGAVRLQLDLPEGYCEAGAALFNSSQGRVDSSVNETHLLLVQCGDTALNHDFYAVKSPRGLQNRPVTRDSFFTMLRPQFDSPEARERLAALSRRVVGNATGGEISGGLQPMGMDESCAYIGGAMAFAKHGETLSLVQGACATAVPGAAFTVYSTGIGTSAEDVARHMRASKALAMTVRLIPR